jgi:hypothetical protein
MAVFACGQAVASTDAVLEWNEILIATVRDQPPPIQNRFAAITQLAVFEAVNAATGDYRPYLATIAADRRASPEAAAVSAAHGVLRQYFPDRAAMLDDARAQSLAKISDGPGKAAGIAVGESAAALMVDARADDGSEPPESYLPSSSDPGKWQQTPDCPATGGFFLHWRNVRPFVLRRGDQFRSDPPPALAGSRYARDYREVKALGGRESAERPHDRAVVVKLYEQVGDALLWNPVARQLATAARHSLAQNARTFALLNMALNDAGIAVMDTKYRYNFWRPETAIAGAATDGNDRTHPDSAFVPFIAAPCFPSYPSGHASTSYAAREVLEQLFGARGHSISVSSAGPPRIALRYGTLKAITTDIDDARVYGGIHFRFDQEEGAEQGRRVGSYIHRHSLRPVPDCSGGD